MATDSPWSTLSRTADMGLGDWAMAAGEARRIHAETGCRVCIVDRHGIPARQGRAVWGHGHPYIVEYPGSGAVKHRNCGGHRPYIRAKTEQRWFWADYKPIPAELFLTPDEKAWARRGQGKLLLAPAIKRAASPNKQWHRWEALTEALACRFDLAQLPTDKPLAGIPTIETPTIRHAAAVLQGSLCAIVHEGGLHHIAAAVGKPCVVIYGGFISPAQTGYDLHANLFTGGEPCGMRVPCDHCREAMDAITVDMVLDALKGIVGDGHQAVRGSGLVAAKA